MYEIEKALKTLGKKFGHANRRGKLDEQRILLQKMSTLGRKARRIPAAQGGRIAVELHWYGAQPNTQQAHIEYWDSNEGLLQRKEWDGLMEHSQDEHGKSRDRSGIWCTNNWCI